MSYAMIKKIELIQKLSHIPDMKIDELNKIIDNILKESEEILKKPISLKGIWKNKGFEKINNLELELKTIKKELTDSVLKKDI
ncbi:MAG: hypothetical protein OEV44_10125 [Spirochaetota bacterium]|nr:hypothetical protein [Spirochaetota bacterium]